MDDLNEKIKRVFADLGIRCAYNMPSFWANGGKDYVVIPTRYAKGYQKALEDAEREITEVLSEQPEHTETHACDYEHTETHDLVSRRAADSTPAQQNTRIFQGIIVEYPSISTNPEYEGKPYFSIKYTEDGQDFIGYGTYKSDVLSEYLKQYFMPSAQPEQIARDIATIIENEQDMRVILKNAEHTETHEWILCSERMPEEHEWMGTKRFGTTISDEVYVTFENPKGERFCKHLSFQNGKLSGFDQSTIDAVYKGSKPIAWMPLPKPYAERKEDASSR